MPSRVPPPLELDLTKAYWNNFDQDATPNTAQAPKTIVASPQKKISRDSLIHKNDVFQFDDVESIHTHYRPIRNTHNFSLDSGSTYDSSEMTSNNSKKKSNESGFLKSLISPILRGVNGSNTSGHSSKKENVLKKPQSTTSFVNKPLESPIHPKQDPTTHSASNFLQTPIQAVNAESVTSLDRKNTFTNRINSLKKLITPKNDTSGGSKKNLKESDELEYLKPKITIQTSNGGYLHASSIINNNSELKRNSETSMMVKTTNIQESRSNASSSFPGEQKRKEVFQSETTKQQNKPSNKKFFKIKLK